MKANSLNISLNLCFELKILIMNWTAIIIVGILAICIVIFTIIRNNKDKKDLEQKLNNDYPKTIDQKGELDDDAD